MLPLLTVREPAVGGVGAKVTIEPHSRSWALVAALVCALATACSAGSGTADGPHLAGADLEVVAVWEDAEARAFERVLAHFERDTGAEVTYTSAAGADLGGVLDRRLDASDPPDLAILPQPGLLARYARRGALVPIDRIVGQQVEASWAPVWRRLGSVDGRLYGVWFKAANKSLIWYSLHAFEAAGVVPPRDLATLATTADALGATGMPAFSLTGTPSDAWTLTDWFENLYLRLAGPRRYDELAGHRIPWTHPTVEQTLLAMADLLAPSRVVRVEGPDPSFESSLDAVFSTTPRAGMVMEGDFVPGVADEPEVEIGVDVDVFDFPGRTATDRFVVGGGDAAVMLRRSPAGDALLRHLTSARAAEIWARQGGFLSPNEDVSLRAYPDATTRRIARGLLEAGDRLRFDLSDLQPVGFGGTTGAGLLGELSAFLADPTDVRATMARIEAAAETAWADA